MPDDPLSEEALTRRFVEGDGDAVAELFARYELLLRARAKRLLTPEVRRRVSISDIVQESQIAVLESRDRFEHRGPGAFRRWALGIVEKRAMKAMQHHRSVGMRSVTRDVTRAERPATSLHAGASPTPSQVAIGRETAVLAERAFAALSDDDRSVLTLHRDQGLSLEEVAERMGRSYAATKKLYGRAAARFAQRFLSLRKGIDG